MYTLCSLQRIYKTSKIKNFSRTLILIVEVVFLFGFNSVSICIVPLRINKVPNYERISRLHNWNIPYSILMELLLHATSCITICNLCRYKSKIQITHISLFKKLNHLYCLEALLFLFCVIILWYSFSFSPSKICLFWKNEEKK